ncbi:MAG: hypothetical protein LBG96_03145 [Tannerella sp.]|jgi:hypothetical protein|nr:hypothetical protein [Tannerella sp.]
MEKKNKKTGIDEAKKGSVKKEVFQLKEGKKLSPIGEWFMNPDREPLITKIVDMRAVLR